MDEDKRDDVNLCHNMLIDICLYQRTVSFSGSNQQSPLSLSFYICFRKVLAHFIVVVFSTFGVGVDVCWVDP